MRQIALLCLSLTLADCAASRIWHDAGSSGPRMPPPEDGPVMRRVMGQDERSAPLLPEPGNVWAGIVPSGEPASPAATPKPPPGARITAAAAPTLSAAVPRPAAAPATPVAAAEPPAPPGRGGASSVQLVAATSPESAEAAWKQLQQRQPKLVHGLRPVVTAADVDGHKVWRLRADGFATTAEADAFCVSARAVKANCWVVGSSARR